MGAAGYGKRPLWQWVVIYLVIGLVVYGLIYYVVIAKKGGNYGYGNPQPAASNSAPVSQTAVKISNFSFSPATLTVKAGDTVTWTNQDSTGHSIKADDSSFSTGVMQQGQSQTATFSKAGTYPYHCGVHPNMHGTIVVQ